MSINILLGFILKIQENEKKVKQDNTLEIIKINCCFCRYTIVTNKQQDGKFRIRKNCKAHLKQKHNKNDALLMQKFKSAEKQLKNKESKETIPMSSCIATACSFCSEAVENKKEGKRAHIRQCHQLKSALMCFDDCNKGKILNYFQSINFKNFKICFVSRAKGFELSWVLR